jgi:hypothetical protein
MPRVRILFGKIGRAAFVAHADLPDLLARTCGRAGFLLERTQGFSPHPRLSLGPALPVGVEAWAEPADLWLEEAGVAFCLEEFRERFGSRLPRGFPLGAAALVEGKGLSSHCEAAEYRLRFRVAGAAVGAVALFRAEISAGSGGEGAPSVGAVLRMGREGTILFLSLRDPERNGIAPRVRALEAGGLIGGWGDLEILRVAVGTVEGERVRPLLASAASDPFRPEEGLKS